MLERFPDVRAQPGSDCAKSASRKIASAASQLQTLPVDQFLAKGLMEAQSLLVLDLENCTRCDQCVRACADAHDGVTRLIREGLRFDKYLVATSCRQCRDPLCMVGCPVGSIRRRNSLEIIIEDWCIGCGLCANELPVRQHQPAPVPGRTRRSRSSGPENREHARESDFLRSVSRPCRAQLRLRLSA